MDGAFRLAPAGAERLSDATRRLLAEKGLDPTESPVDAVVTQLYADLRHMASRMHKMLPRRQMRDVARIGRALIGTGEQVPMIGDYSDWAEIFEGYEPGPWAEAPYPEGLADSVPTTHGTVAPAGVATLLLAKQHLKGYEAVDIAHIENVLRGEVKLREHRRTRVTEEIVYREAEITTTEERDLESTDRFEMTRETTKTLEEDSELKAGLSITARYGPIIEVSANVEGSLARSREETTKVAENYAREVTARSASKITERILERESLKVTNEVEEKNRHELSNAAGPVHEVGIYQWVEKIYQAQLYDYGSRTMFEFMAPEPAAFVIAALKRNYEEATGLRKPEPFVLTPYDVDEWNYHNWVLEYEATTVDPPPPPFYTVTATPITAGGGEPGIDYSFAQSIPVEDGYEAAWATVGIVTNMWIPEALGIDASAWNPNVEVILGNAHHRFSLLKPNMEPVWYSTMTNDVGSIPLAVNTFQVADLALAVRVVCRRTCHALDKWRAETHAALVQAYQTKLAEYEEKLQALAAEAGVQIAGTHPEANLRTIGGELKKACISLLTQQHFDLFGAVAAGEGGLPQLDLAEAEAEGRYVRFFEHAFEWENMTFVFYPYFWGRKQEWVERLSYDDADPLFAQFLKAGFCRVTVPVREGFDGAVDHFMHFGEPWYGGPLPVVTSDLYLPIAEELAEQTGRPGAETPFGEPWEVRLPTSLVRLRDDTSLPHWAQNDSGAWVPA
jgi:hypothetical protein